MKNGRLTRNRLIILALSAVLALAVGHLTDLGTQLLGSGTPSTPVLLGDVATSSAAPPPRSTAGVACVARATAAPERPHPAGRVSSTSSIAPTLERCPRPPPLPPPPERPIG